VARAALDALFGNVMQKPMFDLRTALRRKVTAQPKLVKISASNNAQHVTRTSSARR
jgi:hypothetical protein